MSQTLTPLNNGIGPVQTTISVQRANVLSDQSIKLRDLEPQITEWRPEGRPIYRRLPSVSENYQIDFFEEKGRGYVYVPYGEGIFGARSMEVVASENKESIIIKPGTVVWEYGENPVDPAIINCKLVGLLSTRYLLGYQLYYDDAPFDAQYAVEDYSLAGYPLNITASTDEVVGWRFSPENAFINQNGYTWRTKDRDFPNYAQPDESWLAWESDKKILCSDITLRCPKGTIASGEATLYFKNDKESNWVVNAQTTVSEDTDGFFFKFELDDPTFQYGFKVVWSSEEIVIEAITITGIITLVSRPATLTTRSALVAYPENMVPEVFVNSQGEEVPLAICPLAYVDVSEEYTILRIDDVRNIIHKDFKPITEWLTRPQDEDLINLFEEVSGYSVLWMSPTDALKHEYVELEKASINVIATV